MVEQATPPPAAEAGNQVGRSAAEQLTPRVNPLTSLFTSTIGHTIAILVVGGVEVGGTGSRRALAVPVAIAIAVAVHALAFPPPLARRLMRSMRQGGCLPVLSTLAFALLVAPPLAFWAGVTGARLLGLPMTLTGLRPAVVGGYLAELMGVAVWLLLTFRRRKSRATGEHHRAARLVICYAALWAAITVLDKVSLAPGESWRQLLTITVLATFFSMGELWRGDRHRTTLTLSRLPLIAVYAIFLNGLVLAIVSWLSNLFALPLHITGFASLAEAALLCTAVMWLGNLPLLLIPLPHLRRSGWRAGDSTGWIGGVRPSRYGYRWVPKEPRH